MSLVCALFPDPVSTWFCFSDLEETEREWFTVTETGDESLQRSEVLDESPAPARFWLLSSAEPDRVERTRKQKIAWRPQRPHLAVRLQADALMHLLTRYFLLFGTGSIPVYASHDQAGSMPLLPTRGERASRKASRFSAGSFFVRGPGRSTPS